VRTYRNPPPECDTPTEADAWYEAREDADYERDDVRRECELEALMETRRRDR
jgi:hypothetical protein